MKFPYQVVLSKISRTSPNKPLLISTRNPQTLFEYLKDVVKATLQKKLHSERTLFEYFVEELFCRDCKDIELLKEKSYYPPKSMLNIDILITDLRSLSANICSNDFDFKIRLVLSYYARDFFYNSHKRPDQLVAMTRHYHTVYCGNHQGWVNFISLIYHLDRFDFTSAAKYLDLSKLNHHQFSKRFQSRFFKVLNITPFQRILPDPFDTQPISTLADLSIYLNSKSSRWSSLTVHAVITNTSHSLYQLNMNEIETDILLILVDALTDISPFDALSLYQRQLRGVSYSAHYNNSPHKIKPIVISEIIIKKIILKSIKELLIVKELNHQNKRIPHRLRSQIALPFIHILAFPRDSEFDSLLQSIAIQENDKLDIIYKKFPKFFNDLQKYEAEIKEECLKLIEKRRLLSFHV